MEQLLGTCSYLRAWSTQADACISESRLLGVPTKHSPARWTGHGNLALSIWSQVLLVPQ